MQSGRLLQFLQHPSAVEMPGVDSRGNTAIAPALGASLGFPRLPTALGKRSHIPTAPTILPSSLSAQNKKGPAPILKHRPSGSSFDEKMLVAINSSREFSMASTRSEQHKRQRQDIEWSDTWN